MTTVPDRVYFPEPIMEEHKSMKVAPSLPQQQQSSFADDKKTRNKLISEILHDCRKYGFDEGAIVVKRFSHLPAAANPANWGVVIRLNPYAFHISHYEPIVVKWALSGNETKHMPDELYLIHRAVDEEAVMFILQMQEAGYDDVPEEDEEDDVTGGHYGGC